MTDEVPLLEEDIDGPDTRPAMFWGLPRTLATALGCIPFLAWILLDLSSLRGVAQLGLITACTGFTWWAVKFLVRNDLWAWSIFLVWCRTDLRCLDTAEWGGARFSSFPVRCGHARGKL